jgi:hypothetical protein
MDDERPLPYFGAPPAREPKPARTVPALRGKRVVLSRPDGFRYDVPAISQIYTDETGHDVVDVVTEQAYFKWMFTGEKPQSEAYPVRLVWVE